MSIISFTWDQNYFYMLVYYFLEIGEALIDNFLIKIGHEKDVETKEGMNLNFIKVILLIFADLLLIPFVIYTKCSIKKSRVKRNNSKNEIELIYNNPISIKRKKIIKYTILISILDLLSRSVYFLFFFIIKIKGDEKIYDLPKRYNMDYILALDIFFRFFFSRIILKTKTYKHHNISMFICIIGFLIMIVIDCNYIEFKNINNIIYIFIIIFRSILFPLEDAINQILLSKYFLLPHYLMVIRGIIEFVSFSLIIIILFIIKIELFEIKLAFYKYIILTLIYSIKAFCLMKIIYLFNSQYVSFLITSETFGAFIVMFIVEDTKGKVVTNILEIISIIIVIFGTLMYNEIIIINLFGLEEKTKKNLTLEQNEEVNEQIMTYNINDDNIDIND